MPVINEAKIKAEQRLDGRYLLRTSDDILSADDVTLGHKQLLEVEDAFRTMKQSLELRPVYHRLTDRIRAHVLLCWLGILLIGVAENNTGDRWLKIRRQLERMHLGESAGPDGKVLKRTGTTPAQQHIFKSLSVKEPPLLLSVEPTTKTKKL